MGCCGSKEEMQKTLGDAYSKAAAAAAPLAGKASAYFNDLTDMAQDYNPLQAKGDPNSR